MEFFVTLVSVCKPLTNVTKSSISGVRNKDFNGLKQKNTVSKLYMNSNNVMKLSCKFC